MIGAQALIGSLVGAGVDVCFMNPGTSEMHFVSALDSVPEMRGVLALFEGVATGAADGYARIAGRPAAVLLHLGPGLANGLANLHNARRARSPVVNIVGAHATGHVRYDAPLQSDIEALAHTVSGWVHTCGATRDLAQDAMRAVTAARRGQIATLVVPADVSWSDGGALASPGPRPGRRRFTTTRSCRGGSPVPLSGDAPARREGPLRTRAAGGQPDKCRDRGASAGRDVSRADGAWGRGSGRRPAGLPGRAGRSSAGRAGPPDPGRCPRARVVLRLSGPAPATWYRRAARSPSWPTGTRTSRPPWSWLADRAVRRCWRRLRAFRYLAVAGRAGRRRLPSRACLRRPISLANAIAASLPEYAIVVDEANTSGFALPRALACAPRHTLLTLTGGSIGQGLPVATGAAIAAPDRPVLCLEADGSALYTIQALWTQARERLDVTTVLINNAAYAILRMELARTAAGKAGERASRMLDLSDPTPDFTQISHRLGVPATCVTTAADLDRGAAPGVR